MDNIPFLIRELDPAHDIPALLRFYNAMEVAEGDPEPTTEAMLRARLAWPRQHWLVAAAPDDPAALIGRGFTVAQTSERLHLYVFVHPAWRRQGLGSRLLAALLEHARLAGAGHVNVQVPEHDPVGHAFLTRHGFRRAGDFWMLDAPAETVVPAPEWPAGYRLRTHAEVQDLALLDDTCQRCYHDLWGHSENTPGGVSLEDRARFQSHWDPEAVFMLFGPDGQAAGICFAEEDEARGTIDSPGVVPEHRARQLHRPLVLAALAWLRRRGPRPVRLLSWGDDERTVGVYRSLGFGLAQHEVAYRFDLHAPV